MNLSYWESSTFFQNLDLVIIGSGIVGLNAAVHVKEKHPEKSILVLERGPLPSGASTKNAGFACFGSMSELLSDLENSDESEVFSLVEKRWKGLLQLRENIGDDRLEFIQSGNYEIFRNEDEELYHACLKKLSNFNQHLKEITGISEAFCISDDKIKEFGFEGVGHIILNKAEGQINTGQMMKSLIGKARGLGIEILNGITVTDFTEFNDGVKVRTEMGWEISTKKLLIATNGFTKILMPSEEVEPARNQVFVTNKILGLRFTGCFHMDKGYVYFRNIGNRVLIGGGRNLNPVSEQTSEFGFTTQIQSFIKELLEQMILPRTSFEIEHQWSGIMGVGSRKEPIVRMASENIGMAVRLGGMGVAIGTEIGKQAGRLIFN